MPTSPTPADRPADQLRAAAEKLREEAARAHRASPGPWSVTDEHVVRCADGMIVADRSDTDHPAERADLPYIALMHPGVGLAVARWLESWAGVDLSEHGPMPEDAQHALAVARQLLGTTEGEGAAVESEPDTELRDRIAAVLWPLTDWDGDELNAVAAADAVMPVVTDRLRRNWGEMRDRVAELETEAQRLADAAPPAPADRAALTETERQLLGFALEMAEEEIHARNLEIPEKDRAALTSLRRLANDAAAGVQPPTTSEAHRPCFEYIAEVLEDDGVWMYLGADPDPAVAARRRASVTRRHPDAETRTVRKTTTYTVEPEPAAPAAPEEPTR
ncbi:hypothetical protein ACFXKV_10175 [Streptomyces globisporus]|uniref:hypothetical protein n=1 Tax=Streptomyces globisporus TaxID=1908 RepID=UPI003460FDAB|nr:hypothetical protein OG838_03010 [Streptomyces globisporus]